MGNANSYLYLSRHNIYYFRVIVPIGVTGDVTKQEYRKSLQTRNPKTARKRCVALRACIEELCDGKRCVMVGWGELRKILDEKLLQLIAMEQEYVEKNGPRPSVIEEIWLQEDLPRYLQEIEDISNSPDNADLPLEVSGAKADVILKEHNIDLSGSHGLFVKFCESLLHMYVNYNSKRIEISKVAHSYTAAPTPFIPSSDHLHTQPVGQEPQNLISEVVEEFCQEKVDGKNWTPKTHAEYRAAYRLFLDIVHDMPIADVDQHDARHYKATLRKLPSNMKKKPQYRDKSIKQILAMQIPIEDRLSISKVNTYITRVSSLFNWASDNVYVKKNWFARLKLKDNKADHEKKLPFAEEDLAVLFSTPEYLAGKRTHPYYYWLPLIGLYTGARIDEICQLHLEDIYEKDGLWVIDINDKGDKKVKNKSSIRVIPIHSRLIELGLIKYFRKLRKNGEKRLFPELKKGKDGYSQNASKWFTRYKRRWGVIDGRKTFHSFRHTTIDYLKQRGHQESQIKAIVGHKDDSITTGLYGKPYEPASLAPIV